jgi:hypothetical protein
MLVQEAAHLLLCDFSDVIDTIIRTLNTNPKGQYLLLSGIITVQHEMQLDMVS